MPKPPSTDASKGCGIFWGVAGCLVLSSVAAVLGVAIGMLGITAFWGRDPSSEFNRAEFEAAVELWQQAGPENYDIEVEVVGRKPAVYRVEVRKGDVVSATIDGRPLKQRRTLDTWTVPGMFGTMESDLANVEKVAQGRAERHTPVLTLRATFDERYGYPSRYRRTQWGADRDVVWQVRDFRVFD